MTYLNSMPKSRNEAPSPRPDASRLINTAEMIDRMATDLRARSDPDMPHSYYVEQVKRQLAGKSRTTSAAANDEPAQLRQDLDQASVFRSWAMPD